MKGDSTTYIQFGEMVSDCVGCAVIQCVFYVTGARYMILCDDLCLQTTIL